MIQVIKQNLHTIIIDGTRTFSLLNPDARELYMKLKAVIEPELQKENEWALQQINGAVPCSGGF